MSGAMASTQDQIDLRRLVDLYGFTIDTQQWSLFDQIFTEDVLAEFPGFTWNDLASFKQDFATFHIIFDVTRHSMSNFICSVDHGRATSVTYGHWFVQRTGTEGGDSLTSFGWYDDDYVRTAAGWRIARRRSRVSWWSGNLAVMAPSGLEFVMDVHSLRTSAQEGTVPLLNLLMI